MTNAVSGLIAAIFVSDPTAESTTFTDLALTDSGDGLTFQAAYGYRYWDESETLTIYDNGSPVSSGITVNYLQGSVTFSASKSGHTITATGKRFVPVEVADGYEATVNITNKESEDVSAFSSGGFSEYILLNGGGVITAQMWYVDNTLVDYILERARVLWMLYYDYSSGGDKKALVGFGYLRKVKIEMAHDAVMKDPFEIVMDGVPFWEEEP